MKRPNSKGFKSLRERRHYKARQRSAKTLSRDVRFCSRLSRAIGEVSWFLEFCFGGDLRAACAFVWFGRLGLSREFPRPVGTLAVNALNPKP